VLKEIIDKANPEAVNAFGHEVKQAGKASPEGEGNWAKSSFEDLVQYNDGFRTLLEHEDKLTLDTFGIWAEVLVQDGRHVTDFPYPGSSAAPPVPGHASGDSRYALAGAEYGIGR
jgi:hypothetical protein